MARKVASDAVEASSREYCIPTVEAARILGVSKSTLQYIAAEGYIRCEQRGMGRRKPRFFRLSDLEAYKSSSVRRHEPVDPPRSEMAAAIDAATNPEAAILARTEKRLVRGWGPAEWAELTGLHAKGGCLTEEAAKAAALHINWKRAVLKKASQVLDHPSHASSLAALIDTLFRRSRL